MPALPSVALVPWILAVVMLLGTVVGVAGLAVRDRELLKSPVSWLVVGGLAGAAVAASAEGWLSLVYADNPRFVSWIFHLAPQVVLSAIASGIALLTARLTERLAERSLPDGVRPFRRLVRFVAAAPRAIALGFAVGTVLLLAAPAPTVNLQHDLSPWTFPYRACVQLVPAVFLVAVCALMLRLHRAFGETQDASEAAALKKRLLANALGAAGFALVYVDLFAWPLVAVLFPGSRLGQDYAWYLYALKPPVLTGVALSYLVLLLVRFKPSENGRFTRYRALTERFGLRANGPLSRYWKIRYKWSRAARLVEIASEHLGLTQDERDNAALAYKVVAVTKDALVPPERQHRRPWARWAAVLAASLVEAIEAGVSPAAARGASVPEVVGTLSRDDVEELHALHAKFLCEAAGSVRRAYALQNKWATLIPEALMLTSSASPLPDLTAYPRYLQLTIVVAADAGLLPPERSSSVLGRCDTPTHRRILDAYENARSAIKGQVS